MPEASKVRRIVLPVVALIALAALGLWYFNDRKPRQVVLAGSIESRTVLVGSLYGGRVAEVFVDEGMTVAPGQPVARLETDIIDHQIGEQAAAIDAAKAQLAKAERGPRSEEIARVRAQAAAYEVERKRYESLWKQGVASREAYDQTAVAAKVSAEQLKELEQGTRPEDIEAARAALEQAQKKLATLQRQRAEADVKSSVAGTVQTIDVRPGDLISPNQGIAEVVERSQIWVRVYVPEPLLGNVRVGQDAKVFVDSFPGRAFHGRVASVNAQAEYTPRNIQTPSQRADQVFGVRVMIDPSPELKPGMSAQVDLGFKGRKG